MEHSILQFQYHTLNFFVNHTNSEREIEIGGDTMDRERTKTRLTKPSTKKEILKIPYTCMRRHNASFGRCFRP